MGESHGLGGIGGGDVQGTYASRGQTGGAAERDYVAEARSRQQGRNGATDFAAMTHVFGSQQLQEPLPPSEFQWLGAERNGQRQFAWTFNTARGGLEMQRGRMEAAYSRMSDSSLITHAGDRASLPFETRTQELELLNYLGGGTVNLLHAELEGRAVVAARYNSIVYAEASNVDPRLVAVLSFSDFIYSLANVIIDGKQNLVVMSQSGATFITSLSPLTVVSSGHTFPIEDRDGGGQFIAYSMIQSLTPGLPLIVNGGAGDNIYLVGVEPSTDNGDRYNQKANLMLRSASIKGTNMPVGFGTVGNLAPAAYWLQSNGGNGGGQFVARLASVNAYGIQIQDHQISMKGAQGAAFCRQRGLIVLHDWERIITWNGREEDLFIFAAEPNNPGYRTVVRGVWERDGQVFASVDELPFDGTIEPVGRCRNQTRRYDFEIRKWSAVSDWHTFAEEGAVLWNPGGPGAGFRGGHHGYVAAVGGPDLPSGPSTRAMHSLTATTFPAGGTASVAWFHKFEPTPGTDPYSLNGSNYGRAPSGKVRWPATIFEAGYEYVDKYFDYIETGAEDAGGDGSSWTVRVGEGGQLDELDPPPSHVTFESPVSHQDRRRAFTGAGSSFLFPQVELELTRGDEHNKTPQGLPFTLYGHVDMPGNFPVPMRRTPGRAAG